MDFLDPTRAVTPTLDGPVLAVLARTGRPLTVGEVATLSVRGSEIGIRKSLSRLVQQGIVRATVMGRNRVHELNRDHVAAAVAEILADLRTELWRRMREAVAGWRTKPLYACVFGSAARGDGNVDSDIDLLLVHPPLPGDPTPKRVFDGLFASLSAMAAARAPTDQPDPEVWNHQIDEIRRDVQRWSGNRVQIVDISAVEWLQPSRTSAALIQEIRGSSIELIREATFWTGRGS